MQAQLDINVRADLTRFDEVLAVAMIAVHEEIQIIDCSVEEGNVVDNKYIGRQKIKVAINNSDTYLSIVAAAAEIRRLISESIVHSSRSGGGKWLCDSPSSTGGIISSFFIMLSNSWTGASPSDGECS